MGGSIPRWANDSLGTGFGCPAPSRRNMRRWIGKGGGRPPRRPRGAADGRYSRDGGGEPQNDGKVPRAAGTGPGGSFSGASIVNLGDDYPCPRRRHAGSLSHASRTVGHTL